MISNPEQLIASEEGRRAAAYRDSLGIWTIGIGHTGPEVREGLVWTDQQIDDAFARDYEHAAAGIAAVLPWWPQLDSVRQAYVVSMAFQLGVRGTLQFRHTLGALRDQHWNDAAGGVRASVWYRQTRARAERCARAFETGEWQQQ